MTPDDHQTVPAKDGDQPASHDVLDITSIIAGGDGIARRPDGCTVFVPRTAPGERVQVEYTEVHKQWRRARVIRVLESSTDRRNPPCPYYEQCGGCQLQHLSYDAQLTAKAGIIAESFRRIGGVEVAPPQIVRPEHELGYRNRVSLVLRRRGMEVVAGYHAHDDPDVVVDIDHCPLAEPRLNDVWAGLRASWGERASDLPQGRELRLTLRASTEGRVGLAIEGGGEPGSPKKILDRVDGLYSIWSLNRSGDVVRYAGAETLEDSWDLYTIPVAGTAFVQVNRDVAAEIDRYVREQCGLVEGKRVIDAHCGFGLMAIDLAQEGARIIGIDLDRHAIATASSIASELKTTARFIRGNVERLLPRQLPADVVILDPPRRGVAKPAVEALVKHPPRRIVYISCNPATLARDLKSLSTRFELEACRGFDMFPQTAHVETVATLVRR
jgi:tRNA/tmRNA/rRNA uracil-C5-methylase (TrmA/RlmC/RlmD family)